MPEPLYVTDASGAKWRVHDTLFGTPAGAPFKTKRVTLGASHAHYRIFVRADGVKRGYHFQRGDSHALDESTLQSQLRRAGYLSDAPIDQSGRNPW